MDLQGGEGSFLIFVDRVASDVLVFKKIKILRQGRVTSQEIQSELGIVKAG